MAEENDVGGAEKQPGGTADFSDTFRLPDKFATINRMILRDLKDRRRSRYYHFDKADMSDSMFKYTKKEIMRYLRDPWKFERDLRNAVRYLYGASTHFRRLIQYFSMLNDLAYVVSPIRLDTRTAKPEVVRRNYRKVLNLLGGMDLKNQLEKILIVCLREDVYYGTIWETADSTMIQQLPSDYCLISVIEDNVFNVSFDFTYFDLYPSDLPLFPEEFRIKYERYRKDGELRWQELDAPNSFAVKCNKDITNYAMPPFAGILRDVFDIEQYKDMQLDSVALQNYAMIVMTLGINDDGEWQMDLDKARDFYFNLDKVLPDQIGSVLTPMPVTKISFEKTHNSDKDSVTEAEQSLFTSAGVSSLLFNNLDAKTIFNRIGSPHVMCGKKYPSNCWDTLRAGLPTGAKAETSDRMAYGASLCAA